jgi:hypothetical protein
MIELLLTLLAFHLVADYPLQGDAIATGKNRQIDPAKFGVPWYYWMASHAATHAVAVGIATGSVWLGTAEFLAHFAIDFGKCEKKYGIHVDQALHALCKVAIVAVSVLT